MFMFSSFSIVYLKFINLLVAICRCVLSELLAFLSHTGDLVCILCTYHDYLTCSDAMHNLSVNKSPLLVEFAAPFFVRVGVQTKYFLTIFNKC